jgi:CheY-like chemotaxis protein
MISQMTRCPTCLGIGTVWSSKICPTCSGKGTVDESSQAHERKSAAIPTKTVITISRDEPLQMTRTALLIHAGYSVIALTTDAEVIKYLALEGRPSVNLILLCHSVPETSRISLCIALKKAIPNAPILMLENGYDPTSAQIDGRLENIHSPEAMLDTVQLLISKPDPLN